MTITHSAPQLAAPQVTTLSLTVIGIADPAPDVKTFTLGAADGATLPGFIPGSHLVVRAGDKLNAYSLTGDGLMPTAYTISVLRLADGAGGSRWMHDHLSVGDTLAVAPPRSAFAPQAKAIKHVLVAGGIGVTPIVSHLRSARRWGHPVQVLYTFRPGRGAHVAEIEELAGTDAELFTAPEQFMDRLDVVLRSQPMGTHLYVCGPAAMIDTVVDAARERGWPDSRVHFERFGAAALDPGDPFSVRLTRSQRSIEVPSGTSLLEALERHGIAVPNRCRQGVCGECRIEVCGGQPVHRDLYLSDDEKKAGDAVMPCVSRAPKGTTLEVSL